MDLLVEIWIGRQAMMMGGRNTCRSNVCRSVNQYNVELPVPCVCDK